MKKRREQELEDTLFALFILAIFIGSPVLITLASLGVIYGGGCQ